MSCRAACQTQKNPSSLMMYSRSLFHVFIHVFEQLFKAFIVQLLFVIVVKLRDSMITLGGSVGSYHGAHNVCRIKHNKDECLPAYFPRGYCMCFLRGRSGEGVLRCCTSLPKEKKKAQEVVGEAPFGSLTLQQG